MEVALWSHRTKVYAFFAMLLSWLAVELLFMFGNPFRSRKRRSEPMGSSVPNNDSYDGAPFQLDCRWWTCFNPYNCLSHPSGLLTLRLLSFGGTARSISTDFVAVVNKSAYFISSCDEPCLAVGILSSPRPDREMELKHLGSTWRRNGGENCLIFDLLNDSTSGQRSKALLRTGKAALASCQIRWYLYRPFFDVKIPCIPSTLTSQSRNGPPTPQNGYRPWTLASAQQVFPVHIKRVLNRLAATHPSSFSFWLPCKRVSEGRDICDRRGYSSRYGDVLLMSEFCLILDDSGNAMVMLSRSLQYGCIPVIVGDRSVLPFEEIIDWAECSLELPLYKLSGVMDILKSISDTRKKLLRSHGALVWQKYFSSLKVIVETTLRIFEQRIRFSKAVGG